MQNMVLEKTTEFNIETELKFEMADLFKVLSYKKHLET